MNCSLLFHEGEWNLIFQKCSLSSSHKCTCKAFYSNFQQSSKCWDEGESTVENVWKTSVALQNIIPFHNKGSTPWAHIGGVFHTIQDFLRPSLDSFKQQAEQKHIAIMTIISEFVLDNPDLLK